MTKDEVKMQRELRRRRRSEMILARSMTISRHSAWLPLAAEALAARILPAAVLVSQRLSRRKGS